MEMPKASDADKEHFRSVLPDHPEVVVKPMFGNLGAFVNGHMFAGLFGPTIGVKLAEADKEVLEGTERTVPFVIWCAARHLDDFRDAMRSAADAGGDSDTICAMVGGIVALAVGRAGIPAEWLDAREAMPALTTSAGRD